MYQVAIDPGMRGTGYCVFLDGKPHEVGTINPKGTTQSERLCNLSDALRRCYNRLKDEHGDFPVEVAIEEWHQHFERFKFASMVKCAEARGVIMAVSFEYADTVRYISKGKAKKNQADMLAKQFGFREGSEHAKDALHLGILAGYLNG